MEVLKPASLTMAVVIDNTPNTPHTHVFLIGVGEYPFLQGGSAYPGPSAGVPALGQLTSPQASVTALYTAIKHLHNTTAWLTPLGSIEVVVSPYPDASSVMTEAAPMPATLQNIKIAYAEWKDRCNDHPDNVALFYFCGHGLEKGDQYLLTQDFGKDTNDPWSDAIAFNATRRAFHRCKAKTQLFFIDACRQVTATMLTQDLTSVPPIDRPDQITPDCAHFLTVKAAAFNENAFGRVNEPSFFVRALIAGLKGGASEKLNGEWKVSTSSLANKIPEILGKIEASQNYPQRSESQMGGKQHIIKLAGPPKVSCTVDCEPGAALALADLSYRNVDTGGNETRPAPAPDPWQIDLEAGYYELEARFQANQFKGAKNREFAAPPFVTTKLVCT